MNKILNLFLVIIFSFTISSSFSQTTIEWLSWDEMIVKQKQEKKKVIVDLYTNWCGWCKKMDKSTFRNPIIVKDINKYYYAVKFNAEQRGDIEFGGRKYKFVPSGRRGYHEFAAALTQNKLSYPTYVFLDEEFGLLQVIPGYQQAKQFEYILNFFGAGYYKTTPWAKFEKEFESKL